MTKIRRNWKTMGVADLDAAAANVITKSQGNAALPTPAAPFTALKTKRDALRDKLDQLSAAETLVKTLRSAVYDAADDVRDGMAVAASFAEAATEGDATKILSLGFDVVGAPSSTPVPMTRVVNLSLSAGDHAGTIDALWDPVPSARLYELQTAPTSADNAVWTGYGIPQSRSFLTVTDLTSGVKVWVRVRALGAGDQPAGEWSDPAVQMCP